MNWEVFFAALAGLITGGIVPLLRWLSDARQARRAAERKDAGADRAQGRKDRKDTITELYEILDRQGADLEGQREQIHTLSNDLQAAKIKLAVCERDREEFAWQIGVMAEALDRAGIRVNLHRQRGAPG